jgi:hypothetical protein
VKITVSVTVDIGDNTPSVAHEVFSLQRGTLDADAVGLRLDEAKDLLSAVQETVVNEQVMVSLDAQAPCPDCGTPRRHKDSRNIVLRSLFGTLRLASPRWWHCTCTEHEARTFSPLASTIPERATPELVYLEAKFAGLASYGLSAKLLSEVLPLGRPLHPTAVRFHTQAVAQRLEDELGAEQPVFIDGCPADWRDLPRPDLPLVVGLDGGYVHSAHQRSRRDGWFEVIAGKSMTAHGQAKSFGFVQTYDSKPKRRLFEVLKGQGMQANQTVTFVTDGGEDIRDLPRYLNPCAEHLLDWFHVTMRLTVMSNMAKGLAARASTGAHECAAGLDEKDLDEDDLRYYGQIVTSLPAELERLKWFLWHGNVFHALQIIGDLVMDLDVAIPSVGWRKLLRAVNEFDSYIRANAGSIPNYGERHRAGETISSSFVESAVNQVVSKRMVKKQQMRWTPRGAHLLLQVRTRVLNDDLVDDFHRWHAGFTHAAPDPHELAPAA